MSRNFGLQRPSDASRRPSSWPMWVVAFVAVGVINAATFLHH